MPAEYKDGKMVIGSLYLIREKIRLELVQIDLSSPNHKIIDTEINRLKKQSLLRKIKKDIGMQQMQERIVQKRFIAYTLTRFLHSFSYLLQLSNIISLYESTWI